MVLVDSNIPMYLVGSNHPHKIDARRLLETAIYEGRRLVTDAEVLQEICHRYTAIDRRDAIQPAFDAILGVVDEVAPITRDDAEGAKSILLGSTDLSARDAIHVAVMRRHGITTIMSFDRRFDTVPGLERIR
ncbi:MAG: type II toxin-antitoxin system VapC family toxin [Actinobacteria bacterium]|nr:type II toxin-antitoxin system VapC family toxin [Actinomycetota bacterium]